MNKSDTLPAFLELKVWQGKENSNRYLQVCRQVLQERKVQPGPPPLYYGGNHDALAGFIRVSRNI